MTLDQQQRLEYFVGTHITSVDQFSCYFHRWSFPDTSFVEDIFDEIIVDVEPPKMFQTMRGIHVYPNPKPRLDITARFKSEEFAEHVFSLFLYYDKIRQS